MAKDDPLAAERAAMEALQRQRRQPRPSSPEEARAWIREYVADLERRVELADTAGMPVPKHDRYVFAAFRGLLTDEFRDSDEALALRRERGAPKQETEPAINLAEQVIHKIILAEKAYAHEHNGKLDGFRVPMLKIATELGLWSPDGQRKRKDTATKALQEILDRHGSEALSRILRGDG